MTDGAPASGASTFINALRRASLALAGGLLVATTFPPFHGWPRALLPSASLGAFLGVALFFRALRAARPLAAPALGLVFGLAATGVPGAWVPAAATASGSHPASGWLLLLALAATHAIYAAYHRATERLAHAPFAAIAGWVALEGLRVGCPAQPLPWYTLAHALSSSLPLYQVAGVVGGAGLSALVVASGLLLERALEEWRSRRSRAITCAVAGVGLPVITWQLGFYALVSAPPAETSIEQGFSVIAVQDDGSPEDKLELSLAGKLRARRDLTPDVDLLAWPEESLPASPAPGALPPALARALSLARVFLLPHHDEGGSAAILLGRGGHVLGRVARRHRDPVHEPALRASPDAPPLVFAIRDGVKLGVALGLDATRPDVLVELRRLGARVVVMASRDPGSWPWEARLQEAALLALRACEHRLGIVHVAARGVTFGLDEYGRPYASVPGPRRGFVLARVQGNADATVYELGGRHLSLVALAAAAGALGLAVAGFARRVRAAASASA